MEKFKFAACLGQGHSPFSGVTFLLQRWSHFAWCAVFITRPSPASSELSIQEKLHWMCYGTTLVCIQQTIVEKRSKRGRPSEIALQTYYADWMRAYFRWQNSYFMHDAKMRPWKQLLPLKIGQFQSVSIVKANCPLFTTGCSNLTSANTGTGMTSMAQRLYPEIKSRRLSLFNRPSLITASSCQLTKCQVDRRPSPTKAAEMSFKTTFDK